MKNSAKTGVVRIFERGLIFFLLMGSLVMGQTFAPTGGTVVSDRWNAGNTGGTFSFTVPGDTLIGKYQIQLFSNGFQSSTLFGR